MEHLVPQTGQGVPTPRPHRHIKPKGSLVSEEDIGRGLHLFHLSLSTRVGGRHYQHDAVLSPTPGK